MYTTKLGMVLDWGLVRVDPEWERSSSQLYRVSELPNCFRDQRCLVQGADLEGGIGLLSRANVCNRILSS